MSAFTLILAALIMVAVLFAITVYYGQRPDTSSEAFRRLAQAFNMSAALMGTALIGFSKATVEAAIEFEEFHAKIQAMREGVGE